MINLIKALFPSKQEVLEQFSKLLNELPKDARYVFKPGQLEIKLKHKAEKRVYGVVGYFYKYHLYIIGKEGDVILKAHLSEITGASKFYRLNYGKSDLKFTYKQKIYKKSLLVLSPNMYKKDIL